MVSPPGDLFLPLNLKNIFLVIMMKRLRYFVLFPVLLANCQMNDAHRDVDHFVLRGQLNNANRLMLEVQELTTSDLIPVDSFETDSQGVFSYRGKLDEAGYFILRVDRDNYITLVVEPGEEIFVRGDADNLTIQHHVEGSEGSVLLSALSRRLKRNYQKVDSLAEVFRTSQYKQDFFELRSTLDSAYREIFDDQQAYVKQFIRDNPHSLASIIALYQYFGNQLLLRENEHFEYFELLSRSLSEVYPTNRHVLDLSRRVSRHRRNEAQRLMAQENLAPGNEAPEIVLPDPDGNMQALSSLRGNHVLIDFWAAWCAPCREANPKLKALYEKYNRSGFEIYGISLDRTREQWLQGIREDDISWIQVSDLRFWNSPVISLYNVEGIPYAILIDPDGRIMKKGIDPDELEEVLAGIFGA